MLYKFLLASNQYPRQTSAPNVTYPIVLNASDLSNLKLVRRYAAAVGLDPDVVRFRWDSKEQEGIATMEARKKDTLMKSKGVVLEKLKNTKRTRSEADVED